MLQILSEKLQKLVSSIWNVVLERIQCNTKSKQTIVSLQAERRLYAGWYKAWKTWDGDLDNFFVHENHLHPPSISENGKLQKCLTKSDFLVCLNGLSEPIYDPPNVEMKVIDGAAFVNMNLARKSNTCGEYCDMELKAKVLRIADGLQRVDIVWHLSTKYNTKWYKR